MRRILEGEGLRPVEFEDLATAQIKSKFASMLDTMMEHMQQHLQNVRKLSPSAHKDYVIFVQDIICQIQSHASNICYPKSFFSKASTDYWPENSDPGLYVAKLTSYALGLHTNKKSRMPLFYFLWNGFKCAFTSNDIETYVHRLGYVAKDWFFMQYLLTDVIPASLRLCMDNTAAWVICEVYLNSVACAAPDVMQSQNGVGLYTALEGLFMQIMNVLHSVYQQFGNALSGFHPEHVGIIATVCRFSHALLPAIHNYVARTNTKLSQVFHAFRELAESVLAAFDKSTQVDLDIQCFSVTISGMGIILEEFQSEMAGDWPVQVNSTDGFLTYTSREEKFTHPLSFSTDNGPRTLWDVLRVNKLSHPRDGMALCQSTKGIFEVLV